MIEISIYQAVGLGKLIIPKTLVKTIEILKMMIEVPSGFNITQSNEFESIKSVATSPEKEWERNFYIKFWHEIISELSFDDPGQPMPKPGTSTNLYVYPAQTKKAWISTFFSKSSKRTGVYFRVQNDQDGNEIHAALNKDQEQIMSELGSEVIWVWEENADVGVRFPCDNIFADENREDIKDFFKVWQNNFVKVFRPRLKKYGYGY